MTNSLMFNNKKVKVAKIKTKRILKKLRIKL